MRRFIRLQLLIVVVLLSAALVFLASREFRLIERATFNWNLFWQSESAAVIGLDEYRVVIEGKVIEGLEDDVSALSYDPDRKSLFTVTNQNSELVELSLDGRILRRIHLEGFGDAEAVEYIRPGVYVISDERRQRLIQVQVDDSTRSLDAGQAETLTLNFNAGNNKGFEGLAYDTKGQRLFVAKERDPVQIIEVRGFPKPQADALTSLEVISNRQRDAGIFVRDLSSLQFDERSGHLLALSDESRQILELDVDGRPVGSSSLKKGQMGLSKTVPQAEGIAMDDEGTLYLVSEPNLFYVFRKP